MTSKKRQRKTKQKAMILEALASVATHPTAMELYEMVRKKIPGIGVSTVYRNLERLENEGLALRLSWGQSPDRFDARTSLHHHLRCVICGKVVDLPPELSRKAETERESSLNEAVEKATGFLNVQHSLDFFGICPLCRSGKNED